MEQLTDLKRFYVSSYKSHLMENKYAVATINKKINSLRVTGKGGKYQEIPRRPDLIDLIKVYIRSERQENKHRESPN